MEKQLTAGDILKRHDEAQKKFFSEPRNKMKAIFIAATNGDKGAEDVLLDLAVLGLEQLQRNTIQYRQS